MNNSWQFVIIGKNKPMLLFDEIPVSEEKLSTAECEETDSPRSMSKE